MSYHTLVYLSTEFCKWIPQTVSGFRILFNTEQAYEQLKAELEFLSLVIRNLKAKTETLSAESTNKS